MAPARRLPRGARSHPPWQCACGAHPRGARFIERRISRTAVASAIGESSRCRAGSRTTGTPRSLATYSIDSSPSARVPATMTTSWPRSRCRAASSITCKRCAADVQPRDGVDDRERLVVALRRHAGAGSAREGLRCEHDERTDETEREPEQRRHRRTSEERGACDRAEERAEPGQAEVGRELVALGRRPFRPDRSPSRAALAMQREQQLRARRPRARSPPGRRSAAG